MKALIRLLTALGLALIVDWFSKIWIEQALPPYQPAPIAGEFFRLTLGYNTGVAFGMFANGGIGPLIITGIVIVGLTIWFIQALITHRVPPQAGWPIGLLLGGAIANFADRLVDGRVTDFLDVGLGITRWPTFNLADSFIIIGMAWLVLLSYSHPEPQVESAPVEETLANPS